MIRYFAEALAKMIFNQAFSKAAMALNIATGSATVAALAAAYSTPATLASIASFGGAAIAGESALLTALATTKAASLAGIAHGGLPYVPREGTYLLDRGERVLNREENRRHNEQPGSGQSTTPQVINISMDGFEFGRWLVQQVDTGAIVLPARA